MERSLIFRGKNAIECEEFILAFHQMALKAERLGNDEWMAQHVVAFLAGDALRWYVHLDAITRTSWAAMRLAMLEKWTESETQDDEPAAAWIPLEPLPAFADLAPAKLLCPPIPGAPLSFKIKLISNSDRRLRGYLSKRLATVDHPGAFLVTSDPSQAVTVELKTNENRDVRVQLMDFLPSPHYQSAYYLLAQDVPSFSETYGSCNILCAGTEYKAVTSNYSSNVTYSFNMTYRHQTQCDERTRMWRIDGTGSLKSGSYFANPVIASLSDGSVILASWSIPYREEYSRDSVDLKLERIS